MTVLDKPVIIIPAYKPNDSLVSLVIALIKQYDASSIVVVNDGSGKDFSTIFEKLECMNIKVLIHSKNQGKGAALQTAFRYFLDNPNYKKSPGVVTADADGQHLPDDILKICRHLAKKPKRLYLGSRKVDGKKVPLRSRIGNVITRFIFNTISHQEIPDTQTGLRGIPRFFLDSLFLEALTGYEYELEMLLMASDKKIPFKVISIRTIYEPGNPTSHFNPIVDSLKVYAVFLRFIAISVLSAALDFSIFFICFYLFGKKIFLSMVAGRVISGCFNFFLNKRVAFKCEGDTKKAATRYIGLASILALLAYLMVKAIHSLHFNIFYSKLFGEALLFLLSFLIQRYYIFSNKS